MKTPPDPPSSMERHSRKCAICTHPNREAIEQAFLHRSRRVWARVWADDSAQQNDDSAQRTIVQIVKDYNLPSLSSLYRHAHATGLWQLRPNPNRESNRENRPSPAEQSNSNRESRVRADDSARQYIVETSNRENRLGSRLMTAEIQRMLIGK